VHFLQNQLPMHDGPVNGKVDPKRFRVVRADVSPLIEVLQSENDDQRWRLDVSFGEGDYEADPFAVLDAWQAGRSLVPLLDGGWAPLPKDWLTKHGTLLRELLDARDAKGQVDRNATAALVELLEDTDAVVPKDLARLQRFLAGAEGLPEAVLPEGFNATLRPYQQAGFRWLCFLRDMSLNGILADDMGLGKTVQALTVLADTKGPHLVVAPTSVLRNWASETARFAPRLKVNVYHGASRHLDEDADIIITSYALLRLDLDALQQRERGWVVLDEAQAIKNPSSQTARSACKVPSRHRLCLTGTPVENRLEELWSLFRFLMPGLLGSERGFRDRFVRPIENGDDATRTALRHRVKPYALRRLKRQVAPELPKLTEVIVRCTMGEAQRKVYEAVRIAARAEVREALAIPGKKGATFQVLEALLRMRQACCDPRLLPGDAGAGAPSAKLDRMEELLVEVVAEDHKALVFSQWTSLLDQAQARLDDLGIAWVRLDGATRNRQDVIDHFQSGDGPPVFLLSLKAGGTGLNLTAADYVIHLDPWWNPAVERQATDRAHRIGQDKPVVSVKLIAQDSVEERILLLQDAKRDLAEAALGTEGGFVKALSSAELRELFEDL
ncbi:MAG: helicase, partial [Rhodobacterales bacterium]|nr:helicase [Rhodobacterales bacterium]